MHVKQTQTFFWDTSRADKHKCSFLRFLGGEWIQSVDLEQQVVEANKMIVYLVKRSSKNTCTWKKKVHSHQINSFIPVGLAFFAGYKPLSHFEEAIFDELFRVTCFLCISMKCFKLQHLTSVFIVLGLHLTFLEC